MQTQSLPVVVANLHLWTDTERERDSMTPFTWPTATDFHNILLDCCKAQAGEPEQEEERTERGQKVQRTLSHRRV